MAMRLKSMPTSPLSVVIQHLRANLRPDGDGMTDGELLARFVRSRDEDALAVLVRRHASMVWGVCRRLLHHHDAEDAFQATFLVLVRKAADVPGQAVANWLYGVARQTAVRLRTTAAKRGQRESQVVNMPEPNVVEVLDADLQAVLDEELSRLPDHYRGVVVLCDLEGMTRKEAARQLGIPEGSVASRLARARAMLAKRLAKRGVTLPGGALAAVLSAGSASSAPPALVASTIKVASLLAAGQAVGVVSVKVAALTEGVVQAMFVTKIKSVLAVVLVAAVAFGGVGVTLTGKLSGQPPIPSENKETPAQPGGKAKADEGTVVLGVRIPDGGTVLLKVKADEGTVKIPDGGTVLLGGKQTAAGQDDKKPAAEKPVEPAAKQQEKEAFTAWGKEVGGLQAGLGYELGEKRVHRPGETVKLVVRVRNVGKEAVKFEYLYSFFVENPPIVTDDKGKQIPLGRMMASGKFDPPTKINLEPGKAIELYELKLELKPSLYATGKSSVQYERVFGNSSLGAITLDPTLSKLATGKMELEIKADPPPAAAKNDVLTPEEAMRLAGGKKATVEFKVEYVGKSILVKTDGGKDAGWATGHGPDDMCLRPKAFLKAPEERVKVRFEAILTEKAITQLKRAGVTDVGKHFQSKTVRVTGQTSWSAYDGFGTPDVVEVIVNDLSQLEVVD